MSAHKKKKNLSDSTQRMKKVMFNLPVDLVHELDAIPRGKRSAFVSQTLEKQLKIFKRIQALEDFESQNLKIPIRREEEGWDFIFPSFK